MQKHNLIQEYPAEEKKTQQSTRNYKWEREYPAEDKESQLNATQASWVREIQLCFECDPPTKDK